MPDMPDPDRLREAVNSFLVASSEKRSDQPDMPYVEIMGPSLDDVAFVLDAARFLLSLLDEGSRVVVEAPCDHGFDRSHWVDAERRCDGAGSRKVVWPTPAFKFHDCIGTFGAPCPGCAGG